MPSEKVSSGIPSDKSQNQDDSSVTAYIDPKTLVPARAIKDSKQAFAVCKRLLNDNRARLLRDASITRKLNDEQPFDPNKLKAAGEDWRHNRSTGFMSSIMKRVDAPYKQAIDGAKYVTSSKLEDTSPNGIQRTEWFREEITATIRQWKNWHDFTFQFIKENSCYGHSVQCWTDTFDWRPIFARCDEALFPDGSPQTPSDIPLWTYQQNFFIHELADKIRDRDIATQSGWNVDNIVKAINAAQPQNRKTSTLGNERFYEDTIRDTTVGTSYSSGVKVVEAYHLFATEATGTVTHYIVSKKDGAEFYKLEDKFENMEQCLSLLVLEVGDGKLHGSKGGGRILFNTHVGIEQGRNLIADNLYLSGLMVLKATQKGKQQASITVTHPFCFLPEGWEVVEGGFEVDTDAFFALDRHMTMLAEQQVGTIMPGQILDQTGEKRTASEINYVASIEQQIKDALLVRFYGQYLRMIFEMQKRICGSANMYFAQKLFESLTAAKIPSFIANKLGAVMSKLAQTSAGNIIQPTDAYDEEAVLCCLRMLQRGLTADEIGELANCPPNEVIEDKTAQNAAAMDMITARYFGNPGIDQKKLMKRDISGKVGAGVADELIIPEEDNTVVANATRMQILENNAILQGDDDVPISPQDNDEIHMQVMEQKVQMILQTLDPKSIRPELLDVAKKFMNHFNSHLQSALQKGIKPETLKAHQQLSDLAAQLMQAAEAALGSSPASTLLGPTGAVPASTMVSPAPAQPLASAAVAATPPPDTLSSTPAGSLPLSRGPQNLQPNTKA